MIAFPRIPGSARWLARDTSNTLPAYRRNDNHHRNNGPRIEAGLPHDNWYLATIRLHSMYRYSIIVLLSSMAMTVHDARPRSLCRWFERPVSRQGWCHNRGHFSSDEKWRENDATGKVETFLAGFRSHSPSIDKPPLGCSGGTRLSLWKTETTVDRSFVSSLFFFARTLRRARKKQNRQGPEIMNREPRTRLQHWRGSRDSNNRSAVVGTARPSSALPLAIHRDLLVLRGSEWG